jgi:hypothetical protein
VTSSELRAILEAIGETNDGLVTPEAVVAAARKKDHPLHGSFVWNDKEAAHQNRLDVARSLIRSVTYLRKETRREVVRVPVYVRSPDLAPDESGYVALSSLQRDGDGARVVLADEMMRVVGAARRALAVAGKIGSTHLESRLARLLADAEAVRSLAAEAPAAMAGH